MTSNPQMAAVSGASVLVGGKLLSGTELLDYAKHKGLCSRCVQHTTHKRIKKRLGILRSEADWVPLTVKDKEAGNYIVYKGYCLQPTCWTLAEAKSVLGETPTLRSKSSMRSRTATPGRERPSMTSVDDCGSVAQSESTFSCSISLSTSSVQLDQPSRHIRTTSSSRNLTPGRRMGESRNVLSPNHSVTVKRSQSVRQSTSSSFRDIDYGYETSHSNTSDNISTHSSDMRLLGRQPSTSSIMSDISDRSSHRHRINRKLLDVKVHESPREVRPAMFYRQPTDSSDSSDSDADEQIVKTSSALRDSGAIGCDQPTRPLSRRRASIGNLIHATPRLLTNLLSDSRAMASSTRDLRNYENTFEKTGTGEKNGRAVLDYVPESPLQQRQVKCTPPPMDENSSHSRRSRLIYGKGKSSSNIQSQQKAGAARRRTSISHVAQIQNHDDAPCTDSPYQQKSSIGNYVAVTPQRSPRDNPFLGISEICETPKINTASVTASPSSSTHSRPTSIHVVEQDYDYKQSPIYDTNDAKRRSSYTTETHEKNLHEKSSMITRRRASISFIAQPSANLARNEMSSKGFSSSRDLISRNRSTEAMDAMDAIEGLGRNHQELLHNSTRRRASISSVSQASVDVLESKISPGGRSYINTRRRASISFIAQPSANFVRHVMSPISVASACSDPNNSTRRRASISYTSQTSVNALETKLSPGGMSFMTTRRRASISFMAQPSANLVRNEMSPRGVSSTRELMKPNRSTETTASISHISQVSPGNLSSTHDRTSQHSHSRGNILDCTIDDDYDADDILQMSINFHDSTSTALTNVSIVQSNGFGTSLDCQDQSHAESISGSSIGSLLIYTTGVDDIVSTNCGTGFEEKSESSITRQSTPENVILRHLCHQILENVSPTVVHGSIIVPTENLWTKLHARCGDLSNSGSGGVNKILTLLNILDRKQDTECYEKCWALLSYITKQGLTQQGIGDDENGSEIKLRIFQTMCNEVDRQNFDYNAKLYVAVTLSHIIAEEKVYSWTTSTLWFDTMGTDLRLKWISVLTDVLHFRDFKSIEQRKGTIEVIDIICFLLVTEASNYQDVRHVHERNRLLNKLIELSFSILSAVACETEESALDISSFCGSVFSMITIVSSEATFIFMEGQHVKYLNLIHEVMEKHSTETIIHQGLLIAKEIVSKLKLPDVTGVIEFDETTFHTTAAAVNEMAQISLTFERKNPSPTMILETISLFSLLIESNDDMLHFVTNLAVLQRPIIVEAIIRLIDSSSDTQHVDEGLFILLCLVTKHPSSGTHLRQIQSIACRIIMWLTRYRDDSVQEFICLILEYLVSEDYPLGQEVGSIGGLVVLSELFYTSAQSNSSNVSQAASRALVGILAVVDKSMLYEYNAMLKKNIVDSMSLNLSSLDLQAAGLRIIHCVCRRCDSVSTAVLTAVVKSMENHFGDVSLLTLCCSIIRTISMNLEGCSTIAETDAFKSVVNSLLVHPTSIDLVLEGMATIKDLARKESFRDYFDSEDAEVAIVSIFPLHSKNPEAVALIFASLNNIAVNTKIGKVAPMQLDVLHFILSALNAFRHNNHVTRNACLLLKSYTYNKDNLNIIRSYREPVIQSLSVCSSSPQSETQDRARYIIKKLQGEVIQSS